MLCAERLTSDVRGSLGRKKEDAILVGKGLMRLVASLGQTYVSALTESSMSELEGYFGLVVGCDVGFGRFLECAVLGEEKALT